MNLGFFYKLTQVVFLVIPWPPLHVDTLKISGNWELLNCDLNEAQKVCSQVTVTQPNEESNTGHLVDPKRPRVSSYTVIPTTFLRSWLDEAIFSLVLRCQLVWPECYLALELFGMANWPIVSLLCSLDMYQAYYWDHWLDNNQQLRVIFSHGHITSDSPFFRVDLLF